MEHVTFYLTKFDFTGSLFQAIASEASQDTIAELSDLSPLTTPPSSPSSSTASLLDDITKPAPLQPIVSASDWIQAYDFRPPLDAGVNLEKGEGVSKADAPVKSRQEKKKARLHLRNRKWRKKKRAEQNEAVDSYHTPRTGSRKKYVDNAVPIECKLDAEGSKATTSGYTGVNGGSGSKKAWSLSEMTGEGSKWKFRLIKWDGSTTQSILDKSRRVIGILAGHPQTQDWSNVHAQAAEAIEAQRAHIHAPQKIRRHRRGAFPAIASGILFGGGQRRPSNLHNKPANAMALDWLSSLPSFRRIAGFASSVMATWAPKLHQYYAETLDNLFASDSTLRRLFPRSIFSAASFNFGPQTICFKHKDFANLPFRFCAITALGNFDPTKGGHLILWELELVIQFPPGSTILIPSAIISHSNTTLRKNETRYSFTQYTAGALFRWVDNQCMNQEVYLSTLTPEGLASVQEKNKSRWTYGLSLLPTVSDKVSVVNL